MKPKNRKKYQQPFNGAAPVPKYISHQVPVIGVPMKKVYEDPDKWNQILFEQANRNHLHQDGVRWTLFAGFALFFFTSMQAINNPLNDHSLFHKLQYVVVALGTMYFVVMLIEGWYYNLYLAHVLDCEGRIAEGLPVMPTSSLDRTQVWPVHPSFIFLLTFVVFANAAHLWEALNESSVSWRVALLWSCLYATVMLFVAVFAPRWLARWLP